MAFSKSDQHREIEDAVGRICGDFDDSYWLSKDQEGAFPHDFYQAIASGGWLGIAMPTAYGGAGLGISEAAIMMRTIAQSGAGMSGASSVHMNIFGLQPVVVFGTDEQKERFLPPLIQGKEKACFAVTEPDVGLNTTRIKTRAVREGERYLLSGQKIWISTAQTADKMLILARTSEAEKGSTRGLSLFYTDLDRAKIEVRAIHKHGRHAVDSNMLFLDRVEVPACDLIGIEGAGFKQILHGMNPERILIAAEAVGLGHAALRRASAYARERVVFDRPIGQNQGIQHPLARCWMNLEAAWLMVLEAARLYDAGEDCGAEANTGKYLAAEAAYESCQTAVMTLGGMGYSAEYHVERYLRESLIPRIAPISPQMILNFVAEKVLLLPRSY
ncbi:MULTISPECIES: acyl-CoA dehydrogenase family protein [unclassified Chelatococcus]|uniref:acyl-CoA dehydrogenase family protein n=1 Tax=unclassified Chelatococcus TaxID=2638111 RepID=UPI001BCEE910|nr:MULTISPECIES: acyl-CoA dehydrogenase family protein [unclassified Chelatococcus]MBS7701221.1 acyl-CoA/acyl-ACP dehydrogenase [Chelatococcus sp. YT9]MBX3557352.1 acyl-CoA/acyl-ACP dehydrogenase [Chelatococcus sp.]